MRRHSDHASRPQPRRPGREARRFPPFCPGKLSSTSDSYRGFGTCPRTKPSSPGLITRSAVGEASRCSLALSARATTGPDSARSRYRLCTRPRRWAAGDCLVGKPITPPGAGARPLTVESDHPARGAGTIGFVTERSSAGGAGAPPPGRRREPPASNRHRHADERIRSKHTCARPAAAVYPGPDGGRLLAVRGKRPGEGGVNRRSLRQHRSAPAPPALEIDARLAGRSGDGRGRSFRGGRLGCRDRGSGAVARSGKIQTDDNRRELGPLQACVASTPGPLQVATTSVLWAVAQPAVLSRQSCSCESRPAGLINPRLIACCQASVTRS